MTHVSRPYWITSLAYSPLLRFSTLADLVGEYFPEGVGISPTTVSFSSKRQNQEYSITDYLNYGNGVCVCVCVCVCSVVV